LKAELGSVTKYSDNLMIMLKGVARTGYENILYLERPGCNLCMGNQEKAAKGDTVMATSRVFSRKSC
jgi:aconitase B